MKCKGRDKEYKETKEVKKHQICITDITLVAKKILGMIFK